MRIRFSLMFLASAISLTACGMIDGLTVTDTSFDTLDTIGSDGRVDTFGDSESSGGEDSGSGGEPFAPCDSFSMCEDGFTCVTLVKEGAIGWVCMPQCDACETPEIVNMADNLGATPPICGSDPGVCFVPCSDDADCNTDAACFDGTCAWPL